MSANKPCARCGKPIRPGPPRCGDCRLELKLLKKMAWKVYKAMGEPGEWTSFFASYANEKMPEMPRLVKSKKKPRDVS
jgi:hypothetical protein